MSNEIISWSGKTLSTKIHSKDVSCKEVMQAYLAQIDKANPDINAIVSRVDSSVVLKESEEMDKKLAKGESSGWLHGFPMAPKDLANTKDIITTSGCPVLKDNQPAEDGLMVARLRKNGAVFVGKTNTPEFGFGSQTYNQVFGSTKNAYDITKTAGGSSGGAGAALATHMLPVADGSDMMGSLRNPAAYNNIFGFRPSQGRVPASPSADLFTQQLGYEGPMGRTVEDVAMLLSVQSGWDAKAPMGIKEDPSIFTKSLKKDIKGVKIGWLGDWNGHLAMNGEVIELCKGGLKVLSDNGCKVDDVTIDISADVIWETWNVLRQFQTAANLKPLYDDPKKKELLKPEVIWEIEGGLKRTSVEVGQAMLQRTNIYLAALKAFEKFDYLAVPSAQLFPFDVETHWPKEVEGRKMDTYHRWMEVVIFPSLIASPTISVPVGFGKAGLPMGMQIIGKPQADLDVLQLAYEYEQLTQWVQKHPSPYFKK